MVTKEEFLTGFNGHSSYYSNFLILNTTVDKVIEAVNKLLPNACVGSGHEKDGHVSFQICKEGPDFIYDITKELNTIGYADDWDGDYLACANNGKGYKDFTAEWEPGGHYDRGEFEEGEEDLWDAFVLVTDNATGVEFHTGGGAVDLDTESYWQNIVKKHHKKK